MTATQISPGAYAGPRRRDERSMDGARYVPTTVENSGGGTSDPESLTRAQVWVLVVGWLFGSLGTANIISGVLHATGGTHSFGTGLDYLLMHGLHAPAWTLILLGAVQASAAGPIWGGLPSGRRFGIVLSVLGIVGGVGMISAYPVWATVVIEMYLVIIYGLIAFDRRRSETQADVGRPRHAGG